MISSLLLALLLGGPAHGTGVRWERNFEEALRKAKSSQRPVMIDFWASWCGWCHRLDQTTYVDPVVSRLSEDFVAVKVNTEGGAREVAIARRYGVTSLPTVAFVSPSGRLLMRLTGFQGPGQFPRTMESAQDVARTVLKWEKVLARDPEDAAALAGLGSHLFELEAYADARELLETAVRVDAERPGTERKRSRMLLGILERYDNRLAEAEVLLKEGLTIQPASEYDPKILYVLGRTYLSWGRQGECRVVMQKILAEHPDSSVAPKARQVLEQIGAYR